MAISIGVYKGWGESVSPLRPAVRGREAGKQE